MKVKHITKEFKVAAKSSNTNSFGLYQVILVAQDGEAYVSHASQYNVKEKGEVITGSARVNEETGSVSKFDFLGHEMTSRTIPATKEVIDDIWNS